MWTGAFLLPLQSLGVWFYYDSRVMFFRPEWIIELAAMYAMLVPAGILLGATAGAVGGTLYLWGDELLVWLSRGVPNIALEPIADVDADVLLDWISGPIFCRRWAGDQLIRPLDRQQLLDRFATTQGVRPTRWIFKAADVRTGEMVGYVEVRGIDHAPRRVAVESALVDPCASERGRLSVRLLHAVAAYAFNQLRMVSIMVGTAADRPEVARMLRGGLDAVLRISFPEGPGLRSGRTSPFCRLIVGWVEHGILAGWCVARAARTYVATLRRFRLPCATHHYQW